MGNVTLIGMPGSGKSTVGVLAAKALGYGFLDTDLVIQQREGALLQEILDCIGTEDAVDRIKKAGLLEPAMEYVMEKMEDHLKHRAGGGLEIECMVYSNDIGLLGVTPGAVALLKELLEEKE